MTSQVEQALMPSECILFRWVTAAVGNKAQEITRLFATGKQMMSVC